MYIPDSLLGWKEERIKAPRMHGESLYLMGIPQINGSQRALMQRNPCNINAADVDLSLSLHLRDMQIVHLPNRSFKDIFRTLCNSLKRILQKDKRNGMNLTTLICTLSHQPHPLSACRYIYDL